MANKSVQFELDTVCGHEGLPALPKEFFQKFGFKALGICVGHGEALRGLWVFWAGLCRELGSQSGRAEVV